MPIRTGRLMQFVTVFLALIFSGRSFAIQPRLDFNAVYSELKRSAIQASPEIRNAEAISDQRRAQLYTSWARWFPSVNFQLSRTESEDFSLLTSGAVGAFGVAINPLQVFLSRWSLDMVAPLYRRSVHLNVQQAIHERDLALLQYSSKRSELDWRLRTVLGNYLLQNYRIAAVQRSIAAAKTSSKEAKLRFELGQRTRVDVLRADANLASLESKSLNYEQDLAAARSGFLEYSGLTRQQIDEALPAARLESEESLSALIEQFADTRHLLKNLEPYLGAEFRSPEKIGQRIADRNPSYQIYLMENSVADTRARTLMAQEWPEFTLQGSLNKQASDWDTAFSQGNVSHSVALVLTIPIFSAGTSVSTYFEKNNAQQANRIKAETDILKLRDEVENEAIQIDALRKALASNQLNLAQNKDLVRLSEKSYQLGKTTALELLVAQNDLLDSKVNLAQTKINLSVLLRKYAWNIGVPLE